MSVYPERGRTEWILGRRPARPVVSGLDTPRGVFLEDEPLADGRVVRTGVILITNRECPWKCLMCDLWKETTVSSVPPGAVSRQVASALRQWEVHRPLQVKLYNSGSFFDPAAIAPEEYAEVARLVSFAQNVVVESHPRLAGERAGRLRDLLAGTLEVALGLETAHPEILLKLNKGFGLDDFARACGYLRKQDIAVRVFLLVHPPFMGRDEALEWSVRSADYAFDCGASAVALIPTRAGNGAMDALLENGEFAPPKLADLETAQRAVLALGRGRVFADTWDLERFAACDQCAGRRIERLRRMNCSQTEEPAVECPGCGGA